MSNASEFNLKKEKCLSCQYYSGCHGVTSGFLTGDKIEYEENGICSKKGTKNYPYKTYAKGWCPKWTRDSRISLEISKKERYEAEQKQRHLEYDRRIENERRDRELRAERDRIVAERRALEKEREKLRYEKWYNSLSESERIAEDKRIEEERIQQKVMQEALRTKAEKEREERKKKERKIKIVVGSIAGALAVLLAIGITAGVLIKKTVDWHNTDTYKLNDYLSKTIGFNGDELSQEVDVPEIGKGDFHFSYKKNGWELPLILFNKLDSEMSRKYDYLVTVDLPSSLEGGYDSIQTQMYFNLDGSDNLVNSFDLDNQSWHRFYFCSSEISFEGDHTRLVYDEIRYSTAENTLSLKCAFISESTKEGLDTSNYPLEWRKASTSAIQAGFKWVNIFYEAAIGETLD